MLHFSLLLIIGLVVGLIVISMGGGGAAIYLGVLTGMFHLAPQVAASTSLITALPALILGAGTYLYQGKVQLKTGNTMLGAAIPAVLLGSLGAPYIPTLVYRWVVALILTGLGCQILWQRHHAPTTVHTHQRLKACLFGILSGLMVGVAGLSGGGPVVAGLMLLGLDTFQATATSTYVLVGMTVVGALLHLSTGTIDWTAGAGLMLGSLGGAALAPMLMAHLSRRDGNGHHLQSIMGFLLIFMGLRSLW